MHTHTHTHKHTHSHTHRHKHANIDTRIHTHTHTRPQDKRYDVMQKSIKDLKNHMKIKVCTRTFACAVLCTHLMCMHQILYRFCSDYEG
jgi:hypothetical protein